MGKRAIVIGGSISGLFTAAMLQVKGWQVDIFERSSVELAGRGAGIVTHAELIDVLEFCGAGTTDLGVHVDGRTAFDRDGNVIRQIELPQIVTSWDQLHAMTRALVADANHHLGRCFARYENLPHSNRVRAWFTDGTSTDADLLVGADGYRSAVRGQMHPSVQPAYAGYVVWRGVAREADLPADLKPEFFETFGFYLPNGNEVLGYPIAGIDNDLRPGHRRYNWVWYRLVDQQNLQDMLTDESGTCHAISIPPPLIRRDLIEGLRKEAEDFLSPPFARTLREISAPFFTPIYDLASPTLVDGRVALVGDAAFVARPHVGMGVTKAAGDARALAEAIEMAAGDTDAGLAGFNGARVKTGRAAFDYARHLGEYLTPQHQNAEEKRVWATQHNIDTIMRNTAVSDFLAAV
ncbi:MAG: FAD-dependent oxidoreductase [Rhodospirillales bacterium]|nr:FAD-dependent oxidoreductase [Rhodospirillales bacterium]